MFDPNKMNLLFQKQAQELMLGGGDLYQIRNTENEAFFHHLYTIFESGGDNLLVEQLNDFKSLPDKALLESGIGNFTATQIKNGKARARIDKQINNIKRLRKDYNNNKDRFPNPFNPKAFEEGSTEYNREQQKKAAWNHARMLVLFTKDAMINAAERMEAIGNKLQNEPVFQGMSSSDMIVLTSKESMVREMTNLANEINNLKALDETAETKEDIKSKETKLKLLQDFFKIAVDPKNITQKGSFDKRKISKLDAAFKKYVEFLSSNQGSYIEPTKVTEALQDIVDHQVLKSDVGAYNRSLLYLYEPGVMDDIFNRTLAVVEANYADKESIIKEQLNKYIDIQIANQLINDFFAIDVVPDPEQNKVFLQTGDASVLTVFYDSMGVVEKTSNRDKYLKIQNLIASYNKMTNKEVETQQPEEVKVAEETNVRQQEILDEAGVNIELKNPNNTPMLNDLLKRKYNSYSALAAQK